MGTVPTRPGRYARPGTKEKNAAHRPLAGPGSSDLSLASAELRVGAWMARSLLAERHHLVYRGSIVSRPIQATAGRRPVEPGSRAEHPVGSCNVEAPFTHECPPREPGPCALCTRRAGSASPQATLASPRTGALAVDRGSRRAGICGPDKGYSLGCVSSSKHPIFTRHCLRRTAGVSRDRRLVGGARRCFHASCPTRAIARGHGKGGCRDRPAGSAAPTIAAHSSAP